MPLEAPISTSPSTEAQEFPFNYAQPLLFQYGNGLYQVSTDSSGAHIQIQKSLDQGATWALMLSQVAQSDLAQFACTLIGTTIFFWYLTSGGSATATSLGAYDLTTDTFSVVTTTGSVSLPKFCRSMLMDGADANHIFVVSDRRTATSPFSNAVEIDVSEYISNVATSIGTLSDGTGASNPHTKLQTIILGASGILHVLYSHALTGPVHDHLKYFNVNAGVLSSASTVLNDWSDADINEGSIGPPVQIGSNIYFSFYLPSAGQIQLCAFADVASPTFTFTVIEPSWTLTPHTVSGATGLYVTALTAFGGTILICFYVNTQVNALNGFGSGDGILYCRTSSDLGVTWSTVQEVIQHVDSAVSLVIPIISPSPVVGVAGTLPFNPLAISYKQNTAPFVSTASSWLRWMAYCPSINPPPPPPPPPTSSTGWLVGGG